MYDISHSYTSTPPPPIEVARALRIPKHEGKLDEIDLITPSATKINEVRRATLIDSKAALDEERKDVAL